MVPRAYHKKLAGYAPDLLTHSGSTRLILTRPPTYSTCLPLLTYLFTNLLLAYSHFSCSEPALVPVSSAQTQLQPAQVALGKSNKRFKLTF